MVPSHSNPETRVPAAAFVLLLLLVSGAVALVYQSLWTRQLSLILGSTTYAIGTVLAAFMAGLGVGAFVLGRRADRVPRPLRLYALLEVAIGVCGLLSPVLLAQGNGLYALCYGQLHGHPALLTLARFLIGFLFVAVPAFLMGGTLPVATRHLVRQAGGLGRSLGRLYALNTLGAAIGVVALPFVLLPSLGVRATLLACGVTNIAIGLVAWGIAGRGAPVPGAAVPAPGASATGSPMPSGLLVAFFLSGFVALALESVWNRFFAMYFGSSIYSYAVILALYLGGIVAGGFAFTLCERRGFDPRRVFVVCLVLLIVDLALTVPVMNRVLYLQLVVLDRLGLGFATFHLANTVAAVLIILPPTVLFGISFPAVATAASRGIERLGGELGFVYLVNTAGTTLGALATSFVLIPGIGVRGTLDLLALVTAAAVACAAGRRWWRRRYAWLQGAALLGLACVPVLLPAWDYRLMHTPINKEPGLVLKLWRAGKLAESLATINVLEVRDGLDATVSVADYGSAMRALLVNGKADASNRDAFSQAMLGHLPLLLRPAARDVLVVGFGAGVTLAATVVHPAARIDLVEISVDVLDLGDRHFRSLHHDALRDPRVTSYIEDGRNFIAFHPTRTYDVIISQPSNPWMTGVANLFTDDFFAAVRRRLRPGGILAQWFQYYSMSPDDVWTLIATLRHRFPNVYVFGFYERLRSLGDLVVLASDAPIDFTPALASFAADGGSALGRLGLTVPEDLASALLASPETLDQLLAGAALNSDDHPRIELQAPRALFGSDQFVILRALLEASGGAHLPAALPATAGDGVELMPGSGLHMMHGGYRLVGMPAGSSLFSREFRRVLTFTADGDGTPRLEALRANGVLDRAGLDQLAAEAVASRVDATGEVTVDGQTAIVYRAPATGRTVVAWSCPEMGPSLAVVDLTGGSAAPPLRCRPAGG